MPAWTTCQRAARPAIGCSTFGVADRMRLPLPAASTTRARDRGFRFVVSAKLRLPGSRASNDGAPCSHIDGRAAANRSVRWRHLRLVDLDVGEAFGDDASAR